MLKRAKKLAETAAGEERKPLFEAARKVVLAGIGAMALAQDELEDFVNRLVERGEIAEKDARKLIREVSQKRRKGVAHEMDKRVEDMLARLNVPTKSDLDDLGEKIAALSAKVEALKK